MFDTKILDAEMALRNKQPRVALRSYTEALQRHPDDPYVLGQRGNLKVSLNDNHGALQDFEAALRVDPKNAYALRGRGVVRKREGDLVGALADFESSLRIEPLDAFALHNAADLKRVLGGFPKALEYGRKAVELEPNNPIYIKILGMVKFDSSDYQGALSDLTDSLNIDGRDPETWLWLIKTQCKLKKYQAASKYCKEALQLFPGDEQILDEQANIRSKQHKQDNFARVTHDSTRSASMGGMVPSDFTRRPQRCEDRDKIREKKWKSLETHMSLRRAKKHMI